MKEKELRLALVSHRRARQRLADLRSGVRAYR